MSGSGLIVRDRYGSIDIYPQIHYIAVVQSLSCVLLFVTPWTVACKAFPVLPYLPEFAKIHIH